MPENMNGHTFHHLQKGFTLVEMLVAVSILVTALLPALFLATRGITTSVYSKNAITAKFLAEEAMEFVRNRRDSNLLSGAEWTDGFLPPCGGGVNANGCKINIFAGSYSITTGSFPGAIEECIGTDCDLLYYLSSPVSESKYGYHQSPPWQPSIFRRRVRVEQVTGNEVAVTVTMTWMDKDLPKQLEVKETLFNLTGS